MLIRLMIGIFGVMKAYIVKLIDVITYFFQMEPVNQWASAYRVWAITCTYLILTISSQEIPVWCSITLGLKVQLDFHRKYPSRLRVYF